jgi:ubiquinone/menaquinone biosynthesis C-methylase UbiE
MSQTGYEYQGGEVYDLIYTLGRGKAYAAEAWRVHQLIEQHSQSGGRELLDVACGTGLHDQYFAKWYEVTGVDVSPKMLEAARKRLPALEFIEASMTNFDLGRQYDAVTCLFSAIGHMLTRRDLHRAIATMARHLKPGGVLIVESWLHPEQFKPGMLSTDPVKTDEIDVVRMVHTTKRGDNLSHLDMHHLVGRPGPDGGVEHFVEEVDVALWTVAEYEDAFRAAGLDVTCDPEGLIGRSLFIGTKQNSR